MKVNWGNVVAFLFGVGALVLLIGYRRAIGGFLGNLDRIGPGHGPDEQVMGLVALGLIGVIIVAIVKILTQPRDR